MAKGSEVLSMLLPNGGWVIYGDDYDTIQFLDCEPITKAQFEAGFAQVDSFKAQQESAAIAAKEAAQAKLAALGLTADDLKALGLGNN
jgi:hypothetical protein